MLPCLNGNSTNKPLKKVEKTYIINEEKKKIGTFCDFFHNCSEYRTRKQENLELAFEMKFSYAVKHENN